jgi:hypothetical protein
MLARLPSGIPYMDEISKGVRTFFEIADSLFILWYLLFFYDYRYAKK